MLTREGVSAVEPERVLVYRLEHECAELQRDNIPRDVLLIPTFN